MNPLLRWQRRSAPAAQWLSAPLAHALRRAPPHRAMLCCARLSRLSLLLALHFPLILSISSFLQISFHPLLTCLDVDNILRVFTALLLEKRVLLLGSK